MVVGFNTFVSQALQHNSSVEITKEVRHCFDSSRSVSRSRAADDKIQIRNDVIYKPIRSGNTWKRNYRRHKEQTSRGFFSAVAMPYQTFGTLELDLRELVVQTLGQKTFQQPQIEEKKKNSLWSKLREDGQITDILMGNERTKSPGKEKELLCMNMTTVIGDKLSVMKDRVVALRAGQCYDDVLRKECRKKRLEIMEEQKTEMHLTLQHAPSFIRKKSVLGSRKSVPNSEEVSGLEETGKIDITELQVYHRRKCKNFSAILRALHSLMCSVYHLKTRDLRTKVPLSKDYLKVINQDVLVDSKGKPVRHQRTTNMAQYMSGSTDSFHIRGCDSDRVTSNGAFARESITNFLIRPPAMESGYSLEKQGTNLGLKRFKNIMAKSSDDPPESASSQEQPNRAGVSRSSFQGTFHTVFGGIKAKRGNFLGILTNSVNTAELPIWQQLATNEKQERKSRPGSIAASKKTEKSCNQGALVEHFKLGFSSTQSTCLKRLSEDMAKIEKLEKMSFGLKLRGLRMTRLLEHDLMAMRRTTNKLYQEYDDENLRPTWFDALLDQAQELEVEDDYHVDNFMQKISPFSKDDITSVSYVKSKLCLIVQSLPLYELCQQSMLDAIKFFLEEILNTSPNILTDWMAHRKIKPHQPSSEH